MKIIMFFGALVITIIILFIICACHLASQVDQEKELQLK